MGFQKNHRKAALGQLDGGVQAGKAATDNAHVGAQLTAQARVARVLIGAGGVVRGGVMRAVHGLAGGHGAILLVIVVRMLALGRSIGGQRRCTKTLWGKRFLPVRQDCSVGIVPAEWGAEVNCAPIQSR